MAAAGRCNAIQLQQTTINQVLKTGDLKIEGNRQAVTDFVGLLDTFPFWFNIVTP